MERRITLGVIASAHGTRGEVKIKSFCETAEHITQYSALQDGKGRAFRIHITGSAKGLLIARLEGVTNRNEAEALKGTELTVSADAMPELAAEEGYYLAELIGLRVVDESGAEIGKVSAMHDFGAGDIAEIRFLNGDEQMFPFNNDVFPVINQPEGWIRFIPPEMI